jgi:hypothetical protein
MCSGIVRKRDERAILAAGPGEPRDRDRVPRAESIGPFTDAGDAAAARDGKPLIPPPETSAIPDSARPVRTQRSACRAAAAVDSSVARVDVRLPSFPVAMKAPARSVIAPPAPEG